MNKKTILAKPRAASEAPLSPRGKASNLITDDDIERLATCVRSGSASPEQKDLFFAAIDAKARQMSELQDTTSADELAHTLLEDYLASGIDLHPLREQIKRRTEYLKIPPHAIKSSGLFLLWIQEHEQDLNCAFWTFADGVLLSKDRFFVRDRLPRFAFSDMIAYARDLLREIARRFPSFTKEAIHLEKKLEKHSIECGRANISEFLTGVAQSRVDEDRSRGREIAEGFGELISSILLVGQQGQAEPRDKIEMEYLQLAKEVTTIQKQRKHNQETKRSDEYLAKRIMEEHPEKYAAILARVKKFGPGYYETIRENISSVKNHGCTRARRTAGQKRRQPR